MGVRKGAYFYVIDAFIASIILVGTLIMVFTQYRSQQPIAPALYSAEDFLFALESAKVREYDDDMIRDWINSGAIPDPHRTLLEQLGYFEVTGKTEYSTNMSFILGNATPQNIGMQLIINGRQSYIRSPTPLNDADTIFAAKRIVLLHHSANQQYPPVIIEVRTWQ